MMSQLWKIGTLAAIGLATVASVAAQQPPAQQPPAQPPTAQQPPAPAAAPASPGQVVITGCVQRAVQLPVGTSGTAAAAPDATKFILTKASPATDATATPKTYRLDAEESALTAHVGHKVEITGTLDAAKAAAAVAGDPAPPAAAAASPSKLKVASVKMVGASCSE
jgi:hypothetical protein